MFRELRHGGAPGRVRRQATLDDCSEESGPSNVRSLDATDPHPEKREPRLGGAGANIDAFTETQWVTVRGTPPSYPF